MTASIPAMRAASTAFFLDVDGTLLGFQDRPEAVVADAALIAILTTLRRVAGGALALVSGRMIADLDRIMAPLVLPAAGLHGADIRFADGARRSLDAEIMKPVRGAVAAFVAARPGLMLEDKGATLAIHFRHAPEHATEVADFLLTLETGRAIMVQHGNLVAELKPAGCDKGHAILTLMDTQPFVGRRPLFIGDDLTDEHGFEAVVARDGIAIKVGSPELESIAPYRVENPEGTRVLLQTICRLAESS